MDLIKRGNRITFIKNGKVTNLNLRKFKRACMAILIGVIILISWIGVLKISDDYSTEQIRRADELTRLEMLKIIGE